MDNKITVIKVLQGREKYEISFEGVDDFSQVLVVYLALSDCIYTNMVEGVGEEKAKRDFCEMLDGVVKRDFDKPEFKKLS